MRAKGSRYPQPSARKAFLAYFGNSRTFQGYLSMLAKQLPADVAGQPRAPEEAEVDLQALQAEADAAHDKELRKHLARFGLKS